MDLTIRIEEKTYKVDLARPMDISIPLVDTFPQVNAFYAPLFKVTPYRSGDFIGSIEAGAAVNFYNVAINPHGNGTHTECLGHITSDKYYINEQLQDSFLLSQVISIYPQQLESGDRVIDRFHLEHLWQRGQETALLVRTLPNDEEKRTKLYSGSNPTYFTAAAMEYIVHQGIQHLLTDLPSVDREEDGGALAAHKTFWGIGDADRRPTHTITELIYVNDDVKDGLYVLNLQIINIRLDASPSRPVLYPVVPI